MHAKRQKGGFRGTKGTPWNRHGWLYFIPHRPAVFWEILFSHAWLCRVAYNLRVAQNELCQGGYMSYVLATAIELSIKRANGIISFFLFYFCVSSPTPSLPSPRSLSPFPLSRFVHVQLSRTVLHRMSLSPFNTQL